MNDVQADNYTDTNALEKRVRLNNENFRLYFVNSIKAAIALTLFFCAVSAHASLYNFAGFRPKLYVKLLLSTCAHK